MVMSQKDIDAMVQASFGKGDANRDWNASEAKTNEQAAEAARTGKVGDAGHDGS